MNKYSFILSIFLFLIFSVGVFSQTPTATPPQSDDTDVVKISTTLIQIDVTVTDKKGNQITDLKPEDFEILENNKNQEITNFSYIALGSENSNSEAVTRKSNNKVSIPIPPVKLRPEQVRRTYALIVDDLGLSFANTYWVKESLKKFINEQMQEGDLVAILRVSTGIGALQSFTSDKRLLLAAVNKIRWNGLGRVGVNSFEPITKTLQENISGTRNSDGNTKIVEGIAQNRESELSANAAYQTNFAAGTLGALSYVIRGMRDLPGRKSLMLFSEGFLTFDYSEVSSGRSKIPRANRIYDNLRSLAELANRSSVVIYTLDPRGLTIPGDIATAADDVSSGSDISLKIRGKSLMDSQASLRYLAEETGGIPYVNQNDLNYGIRKVLDDQKGYYLIGYQPDSETFEPQKNKFNKLTVKVKRPDLKIRYRSGFFGITDEKYRQTPQTPHQKLAAALVSPFGANEINLDIYSIFYNDAQNRNFIRSFVYIDPKDLTFTPGTDGLYHAKFDVVAMIFDSNGAAAGNNINSQELKFTKEQLLKVQEKGIIYDLPVPVLKTGAYQFRVALSDSTTGKIGAASQFIEIPNLDKKQLTLSNPIVKNYSLGEWRKVALGKNNSSNSQDKSVLLDTVTRQFKRGTVFTYSFVIYNAKIDSGQKPQLQLQTRLFHNGKMILEGDSSPINVDGQKDLRRIQILNAVTLGTDLQPGDYVLQLIVYDKLAKEKKQIAAQSIDFEIVK